VAVQVAVIVTAGVIGLAWLREDPMQPEPAQRIRMPRGIAIASLALFALLLTGLPILTAVTGNATAHLFDGFFRAGALVFGGGHVVLPLLQAEVVGSGVVPAETFLAGYGAAQAVPGPLFTFAAFLGASSEVAPT